MKYVLPVTCIALTLSACGPMRQPSTTNHWACYQGEETNHKDQKPDDNCGLCNTNYYSSIGCVPSDRIVSGDTPPRNDRRY